MAEYDNSRYTYAQALAGNGHFQKDDLLRYSAGVKTMQEKLNKAGYGCGNPDGKFGIRTHNAVYAFQTTQGLKQDCKAGANTLSRLDSVTNCGGSTTEDAITNSKNIANDAACCIGKIASQKGIDFIRSYEGLRLMAYDDGTGVWTIGYGHTAGVVPGMTITESQAVEYFKADIKSFENAVNKYVTVPITQNMFDALVSFTYNLGAGTLKRSNLLKKLNCNDFAGAADEFCRFVYAGEKIMKGLVRRRAAEKEIFLNDNYTNN